MRRLSAPRPTRTSSLTPGIFGHDPSHGPLPYDPPPARRLLRAEAGPGHRPTEFPARGLFAKAASIVAEMLGNVVERASASSEADWFPAMASGRLTMTLSRFGCPTRRLGPARALSRRGSTERGRAEQLLQVLVPPAGRADRSRGPSLSRCAAGRRTSSSDGPRHGGDTSFPLYIDQDLYAFCAGVEWTPRSDNFLIVSRSSARADRQAAIPSIGPGRPRK